MSSVRLNLPGALSLLVASLRTIKACDAFQVGEAKIA